MWQHNLLGTGHKILQDNIPRIGCLHLAIYIFQHSTDELYDSNDEAAKGNGSQVVPASARTDQCAVDNRKCWVEMLSYAGWVLGMPAAGQVFRVKMLINHVQHTLHAVHLLWQ